MTKKQIRVYVVDSQWTKLKAHYGIESDSELMDRLMDFIGAMTALDEIDRTDPAVAIGKAVMSYQLIQKAQWSGVVTGHYVEFPGNKQSPNDFIEGNGTSIQVEDGAIDTAPLDLDNSHQW